MEIPYILSLDNNKIIFCVNKKVYYLELLKHKSLKWRKKYKSENVLYEDFKNPIFYDILTDLNNLHFIFEDNNGDLGVFR